MDLLIACSCGLDPASETMLVQTGIAAALSAPFVLRAQIADMVRRLRGLPPKAQAEPCAGEEEDASR